MKIPPIKKYHQALAWTVTGTLGFFLGLKLLEHKEMQIRRKYGHSHNNLSNRSRSMAN